MPPRFLHTEWKNKQLKPLLVLILFVLGILQLYVFAANHYFLRSYAFDFSAYNFAFYDYAHLRVSACPIYLFPYPVSFLQDHFSLTLLFLSPFYWLLGWLLGTYTLLLLQWLFVIWGAWATYKLILLKSSDTLLSLAAPLFYFILLGRYTAAAGDCNLAIIGSAMIPVFLYYFEQKKMTQALLCFFFLVLNREDYALWLLFISLFLMLLHRREKQQLLRATVFLLLSIACFVFIFKFIIPALEDENKKYTLFNFAVLGKTPGEALGYLLHDPLRAIELLFINHSSSTYYDGIKEQFYWIYFLSGGFLLLYRPYFLIPFIPIVAKKMYNDEPVRWSIESFYSIEVASLLPLLVFLILSDIKTLRLKWSLAALVCLCTLVETGKELTKPAEKHLAQLGDTKKCNFLSAAFHRSEYDLSEVHAAMRLLPDTARISASGKLSTHLAFRKKIYYFPRVDDADYVFVLKKNDNWPISQEDADKLIGELIAVKGWELLLDKKDFRLLKRGRQS